ncbi:MAG: hypothetical protein RI924_251 [Bacteroidota bacterium]|jgi:hypothetical protein
MKKIIIVCIGLLSMAGIADAQGLRLPAASTTQSIQQDFGLGSIKLTYSRPNVKGRNIFGSLIPFGQVWRTGANAPTKITFADAVLVEGQAVPAGEYALYTIPGKDEWTIILSKNTKLWGAMGYQQADDLLRVKVKTLGLNNSVETFNIGFENVQASSCELQLSWDKTLVPVRISTEIDSKIMAGIDAAMQGSNKPFYQAASYYFDNNKDLNKAYEWIKEATAANAKAYWVEHLKAKIELKLGLKSQAIESAKRSSAVAEAEKNQDYVELNKQLIAEATKK